MSTNFFTYPSLSATIFDVPEPLDISAKFHYNYFLPDERESEDTYVDQKSFSRHSEKYAREVHLSFTPLSAIVPDAAVLSEIQMSPAQKESLLSSNVDKIFTETDFNSNSYTTVKIQDAGISSRILANIESTLLQKKIDSYALSPLETVMKYASETTDNVSGQEILESVNVDDMNEYVSIDPATGKPFEVQKTGDVNNLTFNVALSNRFAGDIVANALKEPLSPATKVLSPLTKELMSRQEQTRKSAKSKYVAVDDFVDTFTPVQVESIGIDDVFLGGNTVMGYRVNRKRIDASEPDVNIFITKPNANNYVDKNVKYGAEYNYSISVVYLIRVFGYRRPTVLSADLLVESRESPSINVECVEAVPPDAPNGIEFYLLQNGKLVIEWDFPVNPTEDVKRFQIFRRENLDVPFTLIKELDFDDSTIKTLRRENITADNVIKLQTPVTFFIDYDFSLDSSFIYSICSVDAHDLSSPYSEQFLVSFDKFSGKLNVDFISAKNAPKPYPNFLLRETLTEDVMRDSNHKSLTCYFDPEYLKVIDGQKEDMDFLQKSESEVSYKIQLIHLNFQQSVVADIKIK